MRGSEAERQLGLLISQYPKAACSVGFSTSSSSWHNGRIKHRLSDPEPTDPVQVPGETVGGARLLSDLCAYFRRYIILTEAQTVACTLWTLHTHAIASSDVAAYLHVSSPEKQSGKTNLLEALSFVVNKPWKTGRTTLAALARKIDREGCTLLLDEVDAALQGDPQFANAMRGVLDDGFYRGGCTTLCIGQGSAQEARDLNVFGPKAFAGIGAGLPDTVVDRSIPIALKRKKRTETVARFRRRLVKADALDLEQRAIAWARQNVTTLERLEPSLPEELTDRQQDIWEPLLAIADTVGGPWPAQARVAAVEHYKGSDASDRSINVELLADIRRVLEGHGDADSCIGSAELVQGLVAIEEPQWSDCNRGKPLTPSMLARLLKSFGIRPRQVRVDESTTLKGYHLDQFDDSFERYLPPVWGTTETAETNLAQSQFAPTSATETHRTVSVPEISADADEMAIVSRVSEKLSLNGPGAETDPDFWVRMYDEHPEIADEPEEPA